jgi:hypothetical protein
MGGQVDPRISGFTAALTPLGRSIVRSRRREQSESAVAAVWEQRRRVDASIRRLQIDGGPSVRGGREQFKNSLVPRLT